MKSMPSWSQFQEVGTVDQQANADTAVTFLPDREGEYAQRSTTYVSLGMSQWTHFSVLFIESITRKIQQNYIWKQRSPSPGKGREQQSSIEKKGIYFTYVPHCKPQNCRMSFTDLPHCHHQHYSEGFLHMGNTCVTKEVVPTFSQL